jgi:diaminohydroxyphosphoribosylaminopyrimidine deaminase/5-amino-6-(5-phosphoribosylamino)uracil reductase
MGIDSVMIEGGSTLAFSALQEGIVDKVMNFIAPKILGGTHAPTVVGGPGIEKMEDAINLDRINIRHVGADVLLEGYLK